VGLSVIFCLVPTFHEATIRQFGFMLSGLSEVETELRGLGIPFHCLQGDPVSRLPAFVEEHSVCAVVSDVRAAARNAHANANAPASATQARTPRHARRARPHPPCARPYPPRSPSTCAVGAVRAAAVLSAARGHGVEERRVCRAARRRAALRSRHAQRRTRVDRLGQEGGGRAHHPQEDHREAAGTSAAGALALRHSSSSLLQACSAPTDWAAVRAGLQVDRSVPEIEWCTPGYAAGMRAAREFAQSRLRLFADKRNDPNVAALSDLSPYYHFGQISPQRVALVIKDSKACSNGTAAFLEESIVRRELADNFCFYQPAYDSLDGAAQWARDSLELHASDPREKVYSLEELEQARSHEDIWNAAQRQMVQTGKMHGFMRMYWAKKILEWSPEPAEALRRAIYLNDKYSIDGRDPNGYVGCAWAVMGTHDMGWAERAVFGKIRCAPGRGSIARRRMRASWGLATSVRWGAALPLTVRGARATSAGAQT
jgi:deoxyribodipyrimidine photolyase